MDCSCELRVVLVVAINALQMEINTETLSQLVADCRPSVPQVVPTTEDFKIVTMRHETLDVFVDLCWLLALSPAIAEDHIRRNMVRAMFEITFIANKTGLFSVLQVETMALGDAPIDCLLDPVDRVHHFVPPFLLHGAHCPLELCVDNPHEEKTSLLELG